MKIGDEPERAMSKARGFTLIELLTVMGIVVIMAGIGMASYFSLTKGIRGSSSAHHLRSTLRFARQVAMLEGRKVVVLLNKESSRCFYVTCSHEGTGKAEAGGLSDRFGNLELNAGQEARIYNLDTGESTIVTRTYTNADFAIVMETSDDIWSGDQNEYGWEVRPVNRLPEGLEWGDEMPGNDRFVFYSDGRAEEGSVVVEDTRGSSRTKLFKIEVDPTGFAEIIMDPS